MSKIYITGDTHIPHDISKLFQENFPKQNKLTKDDYVIILGDFGLFWHNNKNYQYWKEWFESRKFTTLWIDGNHENFEWINKLPKFKFGGSEVHKTHYDSSVIHLMRGNIYHIDGYNFLAAGGALSYDRRLRSEGINYWKDELWSYSEECKCIENCDNALSNGINIDYVLSHTCPTNLIYPMFDIDPHEDYDPTSEFLFNIDKKLGNGVKGWYFGHWHDDVDMGKYHCLYNKVVRLA